MKINIILLGIFVSFIAFSYSGLFEHPTELLGGTELNGSGCVCHTVNRDTTVKVWIEGPETLAVGQTGLYHMYLAGGPAQAGGYNVAGRFGTMVLTDTFSFWDYRSPNELTQAFPLVFPSTSDTIYWEFGYTASDSSTTDTIYSCGLSIVYDGIPDSLDRWNFGPKFPLTIIQGTTPVEFVSFNAQEKDQSVELNWITATETNNKGFEIQRKEKSESENQSWNTIAFIPGKGTSAELNHYSYKDKSIKFGQYSYRLKQIDLDGNYIFSKEVEVNIDLPETFILHQNYPNPFNPTTLIKYYLNAGGYVKLKIFDLTGNEISTLADGFQNEGKYEFKFNSGDYDLKSGVYFYRLTVNNKSIAKKMIFLK